MLCSNRAYDDLSRRFPSRESWRGIDIRRVGSLGLGKGAKWKRAADFASFFLTATVKTFCLPRHDVVVALTSPPLISALGATLAKWWRGRFFYWVMDLNPDEAIAAGWLRPNSLAAKLLGAISNYSLRGAEKVIVLDRFMQARIENKGIAADKIEIIPPWSNEDEVRVDLPAREAFRKRHGLEEKFVVMYSGNHSPCHPLETLLSAARELAGDDQIRFCFIGGGSEWRKIREAQRSRNPSGCAGDEDATKIARPHPDPRPREEGQKAAEGEGTQPKGLRLRNVMCLPYQPFEELSASLSAADLHVVVMGDPFVGTIHPCKIYNVLNLGAPLLYIGPGEGHVPDLFKDAGAALPFYAARHGEVETVVAHIRCAQQQSAQLPVEGVQRIGSRFAKSHWLPRFVRLME